MTIVQGDIGWFQSERMDDTDDGGGEMTANRVVDGAENNVFPDDSELARIYGECAIRLLYAGVTSDNTDDLYGPHFILGDHPADPNVSLLLFDPGEWGVRRPYIANRIEQYLARGPRYQGYLWEMQVEGAQAISLFQSLTVAAPAVGNVLVLLHKEGTAEEAEQYVRLTKVEQEVRTFTTDEGTFQRLIVLCELAAPLERDFEGAVISKYDDLTPDATVRTTLVADAARFKGIKPLTAQAEIGHTTVKVDSLYAPVIPSSQQEVAVADLVAAPNQQQIVQAGNSLRVVSGITGADEIYLGRAYLPGSLSVTGTQTWTDNGDGTLSSSDLRASVDYATGTILFPSSGTRTVDGIPAASVTGPAYTRQQVVNIGNRGLVWAYTLPVLPAPGTLTVSYMALGKWYTLTDNGGGRLVSSGAGTGSVSYVTGTATVTLTALPDVDTSILWSWSSPVQYFRWDGTETPLDPVYEIELNGAVVPGTLSVTWVSGGQTKTAIANGDGIISGDATGTVHHPNGIAHIKPTALPDPNTKMEWAYDRLTNGSGGLTGTIDGTALNFTLPAEVLPLLPGSLQALVPVTLSSPAGDNTLYCVITDDAQGLIVASEWIVSGTVNYNTGSVTVNFIGTWTV